MKISPTIVVLFVLLSQILISSASSQYGKSCNTHLDCSSDFVVNSDSDIGTNEACINGKCGCKFLAIWDPTAKQCVSRVGLLCNSRRNCIRNSKCKLSERNVNLGLCICEEGFVKTDFGLCKKGTFDTNLRSTTTKTPTSKVDSIEDYSDSDDYAERKTLISSADEIVGHYKKRCTLNYQCFNAEILLQCTNQICSCHQHDIYDENLKKCAATPDLACFLPKNPCVSNATCHLSGNFAHLNMGFCHCDSGFDISFDGKKCVVDENSNFNQTQQNPVSNPYPEKTLGFYGKNCNSNEDCESPNILLCQENNCSCPSNSSFWDQNDKICRSYARHFCSEENPCVKNAVCFNSICLCENGYHRNHHGHCISMINEDSENVTAAGYSGYVGWILAAIFFIISFAFAAFFAFKKWKNSLPSWPILYKIHKNKNEAADTIQILN